MSAKIIKEIHIHGMDDKTQKHWQQSLKTDGFAHHQAPV